MAKDGQGMPRKKPKPMAGRRADGTPVVPDGYPELLDDLKARIRAAQVKAALAVNRELIVLYWTIGRAILKRQQVAGWGAKVIDRLGKDLQNAFPGVAGFSPRNLKYMRAFAEAWPEESIVQQAAAQIPWFHNVVILERIKSPRESLPSVDALRAELNRAANEGVEQ